MKIKTSELTGLALDWAVAKASERLGAWRRDASRPGVSILDIDFDEHGELCEYVPGSRRDPYKPWRPSTDWSQGGPIKEREGIATRRHSSGTWYAMLSNDLGDGERAQWNEFTWNSWRTLFKGDSELQAAMRCFVASKLGDEVDVPEELL